MFDQPTSFKIKVFYDVTAKLSLFKHKVLVYLTIMSFEHLSPFTYRYMQDGPLMFSPASNRSLSILIHTRRIFGLSIYLSSISEGYLLEIEWPVRHFSTHM